MTWFKVDDSFYDHPKTFDAPDCAVALWVRAGTWSARNLTDGFVPAGMPVRLCDDHDTAVRELLRRGLWSRIAGGYRFHDWGDYQPKADDVRDLRTKRAEAGRLGGLAKAAKQNGGKTLANAEPDGKQNPAPTRPVPKKKTSSSSPRAGKQREVSDDDPDFSAFWAAYPRKDDKGHARKAWPRALDKAKPETIIAGCRRYAGICTSTRTERRFIALPATWLNGERWADQRPSNQPSHGIVPPWEA